MGAQNSITGPCRAIGAHGEQGDRQIRPRPPFRPTPDGRCRRLPPHRTLPGGLDIVGPRDHRCRPAAPPPASPAAGNPACGGDRLELADRPDEPERRGGQAQLVGGQPAQALPVGGEPDAAGAGHQLGELVVRSPARIASTASTAARVSVGDRVGDGHHEIGFAALPDSADHRAPVGASGALSRRRSPPRRGAAKRSPAPG